MSVISSVSFAHSLDPNGNLIREIVSGVGPSRTRSMSYDAANRRLTLTDGNGDTQGTEYDLEGNAITQTDALGRRQTFDYDARNRVVATRGPRIDQSTQYQLDGKGNIVQETRPNGQTITHQYDALDRRTSSIDSVGIMQSTQYDADGNVIATQDGKGNFSSYQVNALNQRTNESLRGNRTRAYTYNVHNDMLSQTDGRGNVTTHQYDGLGRKTQTILPDGSNASGPQRWQFDAMNLISQTDSNGHTTSYQYDALNRKISQSAPSAANDSGAPESWAFDARDNVIGHTDRKNIDQIMQYDGEDRLTSRTRAQVLQETRRYDAVAISFNCKMPTATPPLTPTTTPIKSYRQAKPMWCKAGLSRRPIKCSPTPMARVR
ncbi:MAG: RHS repeat protein [Brachymonas sp.]|nr:RHS repeat protein [Brachymonas sp.]